MAYCANDIVAGYDLPAFSMIYYTFAVIYCAREHRITKMAKIIKSYPRFAVYAGGIMGFGLCKGLLNRHTLHSESLLQHV